MNYQHIFIVLSIYIENPLVLYSLCSRIHSLSNELRRPLPAGQDQWLERSAIAALHEFLGMSRMPVPVAATIMICIYICDYIMIFIYIYDYIMIYICIYLIYDMYIIYICIIIYIIMIMIMRIMIIVNITHLLLYMYIQLYSIRIYSTGFFQLESSGAYIYTYIYI